MDSASGFSQVALLVVLLITTGILVWSWSLKRKIKLTTSELDLEIIELKNAKKALLESERRLSAIIDFLPDATLVIDREGKVIAWNRAIEDMTGVRSEDILGRGSYEYALPLYGERRRILIDLAGAPPEVIQKYSNITLEKDVIIAESALPRLKGENRFLWGKASVIRDSDGQNVGAIESIRDITEKKMAEKALQEAHDKLEERVRERTAELKAVNEELKRFVYIVSHDMRAPLINLMGFAGELRSASEAVISILNDILPGISGEKQAKITGSLLKDIPEALHFIESSVRRMDTMIDLILKLSRVGRRELIPESIRMNDLVAFILESLAHQIEENRVRVIVEPLPDVTADRMAMEQIMGNLLDNAVKYLVPGRMGEIHIRGEKGKEFTTFEIQDNGRGIAEDDIPRVFEIFRRVGAQDVAGEGMGLAYVRAMVHRHGGRISCKSSLGAGSTFTFTVRHNLAGGNTYE